VNAPSPHAVALSIVVPVCEGHGDLAAIHRGHADAAGRLGLAHEFVYVLDGDLPGALDTLGRLRDAGLPVRILRLGRAFGPAVATQAGVDQAAGERVLVLPPGTAIGPEGAAALVAALAEADVADARDEGRPAGPLRRMQSAAYHALAGRLLGYRGGALGGGPRAFRRALLDEIPLYGERYRFLPLLAWRHGFRVVRIDVRSAAGAAPPPAWGVRDCLGGLLDLLAIFFLMRFTKRPLRFFGAIGTGVFAAGVLVSGYLLGLKLFLHQRLADRPMLLLGALLVVLGVQIVALGLIGEIVIYTHAREVKEYAVEEVVG
jgi:hypothetical protein